MPMFREYFSTAVALCAGRMSSAMKRLPFTTMLPTIEALAGHGMISNALFGFRNRSCPTTEMEFHPHHRMAYALELDRR